MACGPDGGLLRKKGNSFEGGSKGVTSFWTQADAANRSPDEANVRNKMVFASSKDALRRRLDGIQIEIQATDYSEITKDAGEFRSDLYLTSTDLGIVLEKAQRR